MAQGPPNSSYPYVLGIHNEVVCLAKKLELCLVGRIDEVEHLNPKIWKVCVDPAIETKLVSSKISSISLARGSHGLGDSKYLVTIGYSSGLLVLARVDSKDIFHVVSHTDQNHSAISQVKIVNRTTSDTDYNLSLVYCYALLSTNEILKFTWHDKIQNTIPSGEGVIYFDVNIQNNAIAIIGKTGLLVRSLDTGAIHRCCEGIKTVDYKNQPLSWHPSKNLLAFCDSNTVSYTCAPKWDVYRFTSNSPHEDDVGHIQFSICGDFVLLLTASRDKIIIWDFDTQSMLYSHKGCDMFACALLRGSNRTTTLAVFGTFKGAELWRCKKLSMLGEELIEEAKTGVHKRKISRLKRHANEMDDIESNKIVEIEAREDRESTHDENLSADVEMGENMYKGAHGPHEQNDDDTIDYNEDGDDIMEAHAKMMYNHDTPMDHHGTNAVMREVVKIKKKLSTLDHGCVQPRTLVPGSCTPPDDAALQWVLYWDEVGHVTKQLVSDVSYLHIHVFSGPVAGYIRKQDRYNCHTAALNQRTLVTGNEVHVDGGNTHGIFTFLNLETGDYWERRFFNEYISGVAVGDSHVALVMRTGTLYVLSLAGSVIGVMRLKGAPVAIAARGNMLALITEATTLGHVSSVRHVQLFWVNGLRGLAKNPGNRIVDLYSDSLVLGPGIRVAWISLSKQHTVWISDTAGQLMALMPAVASVYKVGGYSLEWVPFNNLEDVIKDTDRNNCLFPLYVCDLKLHFILLKPGQSAPMCSQPINFMGYSLKKAALRIEGCVGAYLPFEKYNSLISRDPQLREVVDSELVADVAFIPWQQYDEMRYIQSLQACQSEYMLKMTQNYNFWLQNAQTQSKDTLYALGYAERTHDKWLLRIVRKSKERKQDHGILADALWMFRFPRCLETAASIIEDQFDAKRRSTIQDAALLLENALAIEQQSHLPTMNTQVDTARDAAPPQHKIMEAKTLCAQGSIPKPPFNVYTESPDEGDMSLFDDHTPAPDIGSREVEPGLKGFVPVEQPQQSNAWFKNILGP